MPLLEHSVEHSVELTSLTPTKMKTTFILLCLAMFVAAVFGACDPNTNGMPSCTADMNDMKYRNFWDPTRYWKCIGGSAVSADCEKGGFDSGASTCVDWSVWKWVEPCPETS